ncbi:Protein kinase domain containing protein [Entamoeba marina]
MSKNSLPSLSYDDYFYYDVVENGKIADVSNPKYTELAKGKEFLFNDGQNGKMFHIKPIYDEDVEDEDVEDEDEKNSSYSIKICIAEAKLNYTYSRKQLEKPDHLSPLIFISLQDIDPDDFILLQEFLTSDEYYHEVNFVEVFEANIGNIVCFIYVLFINHIRLIKMIIPQLLFGLLVECIIKNNSSYLKNGLRRDEINFMIYDLLKIAQSVVELDQPCVIDERTVVLTKDYASPFPKLMLSPFAYVLSVVNGINGNGNKELLPQIADLIEKIENKENAELIKELRNNTSIKNIMESEIVQKLENFLNIPLFDPSDYDYFDNGKLGSGGYGTVNKAMDKNGTIVAIKHVDPEKLDYESLMREAIVMSLCDHKNIVKFFALEKEEPTEPPTINLRNITQLRHVGIVMEYCDGGNLDRFVDGYRDRNERLPIKLIGNIFYQITEAQRYLHSEKRIFHRDIKPENYLLIKNEPYPIVKCCDFGFAKAINKSNVTLAGTPVFAALSVFTHKPYSEKSDLFSLGMCLFYLTTTMLPFSNEDYKTKMKNKVPINFPVSIKNNKYYKDIIDLVTQLIEYEEEDRISWKQFYEHPYMVSIRPK